MINILVLFFFRADFDVPAVPDRSRYEIKKYKKLGRAMIINNEFFHDGKRREGTDVRLITTERIVRNVK